MATVSLSTPSPTPLAQVADVPDLQPGPLKILLGAAMRPEDPISTYQLQTAAGEILVGLRRNLAPLSVKRAVGLIEGQAFEGQSFDLSIAGFPTLGASLKNAKGPALAEKNRVAPAAGLLYFDGKSRFGFLVEGVKVPVGWICVGQIKVEGSLVGAWRQALPESKALRYFGNMRG